MTIILPRGGARSRFLFDFNAAACLAAPEQSLNALTGHVATFGRDGVQSAPDAAGRIHNYPPELPAFQWNADPVTGLQTPGVLIEPNRSNYMKHSTHFGDFGVWVQTNVAVTLNVFTAPDGTPTADLATVVATGNAVLAQQVVAMPVGPVTFSVYARQGSAPTHGNYFAITNSTLGTSYIVVFNYATGVLSYFGGIGGAGVGAHSVQRLASGWYRIILTLTGGAAGNTYSGYAGFIDQLVTAGESGFFWGAQMEVGVQATSPITTAASAPVVRGATYLHFPFNVGPSVLTVYYKAVQLGYGVGGNQMPWMIGGGLGVVPPFLGEADGSAWYRPSVPLASVSFLPTGVGGDTLESCVLLDATGAVTAHRSINGGAVAIGPTGVATLFPSVWSTNGLTLGSAFLAYAVPMCFQIFRIAAGLRTLDYMRRGGA